METFKFDVLSILDNLNFESIFKLKRACDMSIIQVENFDSLPPITVQVLRSVQVESS